VGIMGPMVGNILNIEMRDVDPMGSGRRYLSKRFPIFESSDQHIYKVYGSGVATLPLIVNRRYLSGSRAARVVTTRFSEDFYLSILDSLWGTAYMEVVGDENEWYVLSLRLSGDSVESVGNQDYHLSAHSGYVVHYTRGMTHVFRSASEQPLIEACVSFRPSLLAEKFGLCRAELNRVLHLGGEADNPWFNRCAMTPEMDGILRELRSRCVTEPTYRLHAEAMTLELLSQYFAQLQEQEKLQGPQAALFGERQCLHRVKRYLEENYDREPKINQLCALVGFNRRKLTSGFKREFGKTIREYHQEVRMEIAKTLFRGECANVSLVAQKIGYAYQGNFAKAFQKYAGMPPKTYVKNHSKAR
jgi:AraC-like DNA-binding protein